MNTWLTAVRGTSSRASFAKRSLRLLASSIRLMFYLPHPLRFWGRPRLLHTTSITVRAGPNHERLILISEGKGPCACVARYDPFRKFTPITGKRNGTSTARCACSIMTAFPTEHNATFPAIRSPLTPYGRVPITNANIP